MKRCTTEYCVLHQWLRANFTKPKRCEYCKVSGKRLDWASIGNRYTKIRSDYRALCRSCHSRMDFGGTLRFCKRGHDRSIPNNIYVHPISKDKECYPCKRLLRKESEMRLRKMRAGEIDG